MESLQHFAEVTTSLTSPYPSANRDKHVPINEAKKKLRGFVHFLKLELLTLLQLFAKSHSEKRSEREERRISVRKKRDNTTDTKVKR